MASTLTFDPRLDRYGRRHEDRLTLARAASGLFFSSNMLFATYSPGLSQSSTAVGFLPMLEEQATTVAQERRFKVWLRRLYRKQHHLGLVIDLPAQGPSELYKRRHHAHTHFRSLRWKERHSSIGSMRMPIAEA